MSVPLDKLLGSGTLSGIEATRFFFFFLQSWGGEDLDF